MQGAVLEEIRKRVEELAEAERETRLGRGRHQRGGGPLRRWGYKVRKVLLTPWGLITGLRLPRIRDVEAKQEIAFLSSERQEGRLAEMLLASTLGGMSYRKVVNWARHHLGAVISTDGVGQVAEAEDTEADVALLQRRYERGLEEVPLIVADGCGRVRAAAQIVYPRAQLQPCLRHWAQTLQALLRKRTWHQRRRLRRDFWWTYEAETVEQAERWALHFERRWARR